MIMNRIMDFLLRQKIVEAQDAELVEFGLKQGIYYLINIAVTLGMGALFREIIPSALFLLCFMVLRSYAGGYHAKTVLRCFIMSVGIIAAVMGSIHFLSWPAAVMLLVTGGASLGLWFLSPVDNDKRRLDALEKSVYRRRSRIIIIAELFVAVFCCYLRWENLFEAAVMAISVTFILAVLGKVFTKTGKNEKEAYIE